MGIFDAAKDKGAEFLNSDAGEQQSDNLLDKAAEAASGRLGEGHADKIDGVRGALDDRIGNNNEGELPAEEPVEEPGQEPGNV